jgi:acyl carrier protein phosphodiesterase
MNHLAHVFLAGDDPLFLVGNISGDFVHGVVPAGLIPRVAAGVRMHRSIDAFTDSHPEVASCRQLVWRWRHAARVLVDLYFDALLYERWTEFSDLPFADFTARTYEVLNQNLDSAPPSAREILKRMLAHDFLSYSSPAALEPTIARLSRRLPGLTDAESAAAAFAEHHDAFDAAFSRFFPEILAFAATRRSEASGLAAE